MLRSRVVPQLVAAAVLLSLLLTACRVTEVPATAYPAGGGYPGPRTPAPTHAAAAVQTTAPTGQPSPVPTPTAEPVGTPFTLTILHTGEVAGEVLPCG